MQPDALSGQVYLL